MPKESLKIPVRIEGVLIPSDLSFEAINEFVHHQDVAFEEMQAALLGLACAYEKVKTKRDDALRSLNEIRLHLVTDNSLGDIVEELFALPLREAEGEIERLKSLGGRGDS